MPGELGLGSLELEAGIPGAPVRTVEAAAKRMGMGESRIDNTGIGNTEDQFVTADSRQQIRFGPEAVIGDVVELEDPLQACKKPGKLTCRASWM